jgi:DNA-binding transcriptional MerR regulator
MAQWRIKELSVMAGVSVRMLHHYDKIGLLTPSMRAPNGYRWYSEADLARLQQIIALKFFGFDLKQIKTMLDQAPDMREQLRAQQRMLTEQTEHLRHVQKALDAILQEGGKRADPFDWNNTVTLIERYHMIDELKDTWAGKLRPEQQTRYVEFKKAHTKAAVAWEKMVGQINSLQLGDPEGADGERAVKVFLAYAAAQREWEKTRQNERLTQADADQLLKDSERFRVEGVPLSSEGNTWFAQA